MTNIRILFVKNAKKSYKIQAPVLKKISFLAI